jgi:hypothetical protein
MEDFFSNRNHKIFKTFCHDAENPSLKRNNALTNLMELIGSFSEQFHQVMDFFRNRNHKHHLKPLAC